MAIKAGQLIHVGNQVLVDRLQTGGPGSLNIPTEKIFELGNYASVATVRDIPDLSFSLESLDVSAELEALLLNQDFSSMADGTALDIASAVPMDVVGQFKKGKKDASPYEVLASAALPYLTLESLSYRFGTNDNAQQSASLKGDGVYYAKGSAYIEETAGTNTPNQSINFGHAPIAYNGDVINGTRYALCVSVDGKRLAVGSDYTETDTAVTILAAVPIASKVRICYQSAVVASYPQASHAAASATRPAAVKGKDLEVRIGGTAITDRWSGVQSVNVDWKVTLEAEREFGNANYVGQDFDVPEVSGTVEIMPKDPAELINRIAQAAGVPNNEVIGALSATPLELEILIHSPDDGTVLKTLYVPDARFTLPGYSGRTQSKLTVSMPFEGDSGVLTVYKGAKA